MKYGYARVSTEDQNPAMQLAALKKAGCKTIFKDEVTGAHVKRPALTRCLKKLETGDTLIVWKLDRLGRSLRDLIVSVVRTPHGISGAGMSVMGHDNRRRHPILRGDFHGQR